MKIYGLIWDKNLIVKNDSKLGGIGVLARPGNTNMGGSDQEGKKKKKKQNNKYLCAPAPFHLNVALGVLTKYAEVEATTESKKVKAAAVRIVRDGWLKKGGIWYWAGKNELNSKFNAFPRTFHRPTK